MADREPNRDARVLIDIPGYDDGPVTLTTTNPYGAVVVDEAAAAPIGDGRFQYTIPAEDMTISGVWENVWNGGGKILRQPFTVGQQPLSGISKFDCRMEVCSRISEIHHGWITQAEDGFFADDTLIGGTGEYIHWWVMRGPETVDAGRPIRVLSWNGSALEQSDSFLETPVHGEEYVMMKINPREADRAIRTTIAELAQLSRIEVFYDALPVDTQLLTIPRGIYAVSNVYRGNTRLANSSWILHPGRQLEVTDATDDTTLGIIGIRDAAMPVWDDSILETDPGATVSGAAFFLHAHRALGAALDPEEHLRRQLAALDEYERMKRNSVGRIPPGTRPVLN